MIKKKLCHLKKKSIYVNYVTFCKYCKNRFNAVRATVRSANKTTEVLLTLYESCDFEFVLIKNSTTFWIYIRIYLSRLPLFLI